MNTKALLVVDVQKEYIERYEDDLLKCINQRIENAILNSEIVIYIENIKILRNQVKKNPLADGLRIASNHVFSKNRASAFSNLELVNFLKENGITTIEIIGVDGNSCILSTAKEGRNYVPNVIVNRNCVGVMNKQQFVKTEKTLSKLGVEIR